MGGLGFHLIEVSDGLFVEVSGRVNIFGEYIKSHGGVRPFF